MIFLSSSLYPVLILVKDEAISININLCPLIRDPKPTVPFLMPVSIMTSDTGLGYLIMDPYMYLFITDAMLTKNQMRMWEQTVSHRGHGWARRLLMQVLMSVLPMPWSEAACAAHTKGPWAGAVCCQSGCSRELWSICTETPEVKFEIHWICELAVICPAKLVRQ